MSRVIEFACPTCGQPASERAPSPPRWAQAIGYAQAQLWLRRPVEPTHEGGWPTLESCPEPGVCFALIVSHPFRARTGEMIWLLYMPALSYWNGWEEHPHELSSSALARVRVLEVIHERLTGPHGRIDKQILVQVEDVVPLPELAAAFPAETAGETPTMQPFRRIDVSHGSLRYVGWSAEGDVGEWIVVDTARHALVLHGLWGPHEDLLFAGCRLLRPAERLGLFGKA